MDNSALIVYVACIIFIFLIGKIFIIPIKKIAKLALNSVLGGILIYIINVLGETLGFHIGLNIFTAIFVGVLGIPGVILLILLKIIFNIG